MSGMETKNDNPTTSKIYVITPKELEELGLADKLKPTTANKSFNILGLKNKLANKINKASPKFVVKRIERKEPERLLNLKPAEKSDVQKSSNLLNVEVKSENLVDECPKITKEQKSEIETIQVVNTTKQINKSTKKEVPKSLKILNIISNTSVHFSESEIEGLVCKKETIEEKVVNKTRPLILRKSAFEKSSEPVINFTIDKNIAVERDPLLGVDIVIKKQPNKSLAVIQGTEDIKFVPNVTRYYPSKNSTNKAFQPSYKEEAPTTTKFKLPRSRKSPVSKPTKVVKETKIESKMEVPSVKRRPGRPRKSESPKKEEKVEKAQKVEKPEKVEKPTEPPLTPSKSGLRRRKEINYFEMANPKDMDDGKEQSLRKRRHSSDSEASDHEQSPKKKRGRPRKIVPNQKDTKAKGHAEVLNLSDAEDDEPLKQYVKKRDDSKLQKKNPSLKTQDENMECDVGENTASSEDKPENKDVSEEDISGEIKKDSTDASKSQGSEENVDKGTNSLNKQVKEKEKEKIQTEILHKSDKENSSQLKSSPESNEKTLESPDQRNSGTKETSVQEKNEETPTKQQDQSKSPTKEDKIVEAEADKSQVADEKSSDSPSKIKKEDAMDTTTSNETSSNQSAASKENQTVTECVKETAASNKTVLSGDTGSAADSSDTGTISNSPVKSYGKKNSKTGTSATMMGSLLKNVVKDEGVESPKDGPQDSPIVRKREIKQEISVGSPENPVCMSCKKNVPIDLWPNHKKEVHNNLAWCTGESPLDFTDESFISNTVDSIFKDKQILICDKCGVQEKSVNEFTSHWITCDNTYYHNTSVTCAVCNLNMEKNRWSYHRLRVHNNLTWRVGDEPLDLNDQSLVMRILNDLYKKKKPLYCNKCGESKKSVLGFLSHQTTCMKSEEDVESLKIQCEICSVRILPISMPSHRKICNTNSKLEKYEKREKESTTINSGLRNSAKRALSVINGLASVVVDGDYYRRNLDFKEELFVKELLENELSDTEIIKCKFKTCDYGTTELNNFFEHVNVCNYKPEEYFVCRMCLLVESSEQKIKQHVKSQYQVQFQEDTDFVCENDEDAKKNAEKDEYLMIRKKQYLQEKRRSEIDVKLRVKPLCIIDAIKRTPDKLFKHAYKWTWEFCEKYFTSAALNNLRSPILNCHLLDSKLLEPYFPPLDVSCDVAQVVVKGFEDTLSREYTFRKFDLFEVEFQKNGNSTIFCGGPIIAMAWMPTPHTKLDANQILAVTILTDPNESCSVNMTYHKKSMIQFWDFGPLRNKTDPTWTPKCAFNFAVDFAPVWHLEWCPSGCYEPEVETPTMGLLAVAGSDTFVRIYSVPFKDYEEGDIYQCEPVAILKLQENNDDNFSYNRQGCFTTRISWTKASGHKYVAVGYTNGLVALFNVEDDSILLNSKSNNTHIIRPFQVFSPHAHYISALYLHYAQDGKRWLLTGSHDKNLYIWDLNTNTRVNKWRKNAVADAIWLTHWNTCVTSYEETSLNVGALTSMFSIRTFLSDPITLNYSHTTVHTLTSSDWLNVIIQGNALGEILSLKAYQLLYSCESNKNMKRDRFLLGYTELIEKGKTPEERVREEKEKIKAVKNELTTKTSLEKKNVKAEEVTHLDYNPHYYKYEPVYYQQAEKKYGLVFCDVKMDTKADIATNNGDQLQQTSRHFHLRKPNLYPLQSVNKIVFNPNLQASTFYVAGYQAGFVRLTCMRLFKDDPQVV